MLITLICILILFLMLLDVPIAFSLLGGTVIYFIFTPGLESQLIIQRTISGVESYPLLAIVFFVTAGILMNYTGITERLLKFATLITGHLRGGLAQVNILLSTLMGGLSGSSIADAAMTSKILVPEMVKKGYSRGFASALTAASANITPIIPPGIALIIFGFVANVSIGKLFLAGVIPGLLLAGMMMVLVYLISKKRNYKPERESAASIKEVGHASKDAILALLLPIIIIGGIRIGLFSPTEAGAIAVIYAFFLGLIVYREMKIKQLYEALIESVRSMASILIIIASASSFAWILTREGIPQLITQKVVTWVDTPSMFLLLVMIFLLIVGMFFEGNVAIIVLTPLLMPLVNEYGIDPVHFGIMFILNMAIGTITPPMGTLMFTTMAITGEKIEIFIKEIIPFWILFIILLISITYVPAISLWLPNLLEK